MIADIERERGRDPGWFWAQPRSEQPKLLAHWRIRHPDPKPKRGKR